MQQHAHIVAQRLLNLYRQAHVIEGGWTAVNRVFISESDDPQVIEELSNLPTGNKLISHINNLRSGQTAMDSIDNDLLPYGGMMQDQELNASLTQSEKQQIADVLSGFEPTPESLNKIEQLPSIKKFGPDWLEDVKSALINDSELLNKWDIVIKTHKAYQMWDSAKQLTSETLTERNRAKIQADMPEFETYLPMFGDAGNELLIKLRTFMSSMA
ncbi:MAG: hypothetical protein IKN73_04130 [Alphaproteobacteria bacterium]|nr:hypothetical protein [Alphaproteobacteria bacterium]